MRMGCQGMAPELSLPDASTHAQLGMRSCKGTDEGIRLVCFVYVCMQVWTYARGTDSQQMYAAGYLEGWTTAGGGNRFSQLLLWTTHSFHQSLPCNMHRGWAMNRNVDKTVGLEVTALCLCVCVCRAHRATL